MHELASFGLCVTILFYLRYGRKQILATSSQDGDKPGPYHTRVQRPVYGRGVPLRSPWPGTLH